MDQMINLFDEFLVKAIILTENFLNREFDQNINFESFTDNRDRLFHVINQISTQVEWTKVSDDTRNDLNRKIEYIKKLDENILVKLQEYQKELKEEIEQTVKQKENIKVYNLSDVK